ncbi:membrane hypothetical protein [uncultured Gammaproteobacteria bacterium]
MAVVLALVLATGFSHSASARMALVVGGLVALAGWVAPRTTAWSLAVGLVALALAWPWLARPMLDTFSDQETIPFTWRHRMEIWDYLSFRIVERPWSGWGVNAVPLLSMATEPPRVYHWSHFPPSHAHSVALQLWIEFGLPGVIAGLAAGLALLVRAAGLPAGLRPFGLATWAAGLILPLFGYGVWTDSLLATLALAAFILAVLARRSASLHGMVRGTSG